MIGTPSDAHAPRRNILAAISGWCFVLCAATAVGHSLWALYGSGESVGMFDVRPESADARPATSADWSDPSCPSFGPIVLDPRSSPFRAVLRAGYTPIGSSRSHYEVAMLDSAGRTLWDKRGALGNKDDEASFVRILSNLIEFEIEAPGPYTFQVRFAEDGMSDLREATLELRGGIVRVDPRITWGFGLAALACLIGNLVSSRRESYPYESPEEEFREAA
ncbi:MAG: hypothetical protein ABIS67_07230 [Candidatus Eisenbacteria bacterium]